jgi:hypothetical protein
MRTSKPSSGTPSEELEPKSRTFTTPNENEMPVIIEAVLKSLERRGAAFQDKSKQALFLNRVEEGLEFYGRKDPVSLNLTAERFRAIKKHLNGLKGVLEALTPLERAKLDVAAEQTFNASYAEDNAETSNQASNRYGRTDGASLRLRAELGGWDSSFVLDFFQADCALLAKAIAPVAASHPERPSAKGFHVEQNVNQLIRYLSRAWREIFNETPSSNPNAAFGIVLNALFEAVGHRPVGIHTLKRIL